MSLTHNGTTFINFKDGTYRWVWVDHYRRPIATDQDALAAMIDHVLFGSDHAGGDAGADPTRHGPYWRDRISVCSYEPTGAAESVLRGFADEWPAPQTVLAELEETYGLVRAADRVYQLRDLGKEAQHDWGGVLDPYNEFVLIGPGTLTVVIAAID